MSHTSPHTLPPITLRAVEPEDIDFLYLAENDSQAWSTASTSAPMSRLMLQEYIRQYSADLYRDKQLRLIAQDTHTQQSIGIVDLYDYDPRNSRAAIGIYISPAMRSRGYGKSALEALCHYAQEMVGIHTLYAFIAESNTPSRNIFAHCQFTEAATLQHWIKTPQGYTAAIIVLRLKQYTK